MSIGDYMDRIGLDLASGIIEAINTSVAVRAAIEGSMLQGVTNIGPRKWLAAAATVSVAAGSFFQNTAPFAPLVATLINLPILGQAIYFERVLINVAPIDNSRKLQILDAGAYLGTDVATPDRMRICSLRGNPLGATPLGELAIAEERDLLFWWDDMIDIETQLGLVDANTALVLQSAASVNNTDGAAAHSFEIRLDAAYHVCSGTRG